jgi:hypothetical protein
MAYAAASLATTFFSTTANWKNLIPARFRPLPHIDNRAAQIRERVAKSLTCLATALPYPYLSDSLETIDGFQCFAIGNARRSPGVVSVLRAAQRRVVSWGTEPV